MFRNRFKTSAIGLAISSTLVLMLSLAMAAPAFAAGGTLTPNITAGSLSVGDTSYNGGVPSITGTPLNGLDKTLTIEMPLTVTDASGTGNGWTLYGDVQQFSTGADPTTFHTIPNDAITFASTVADTGTGASSTPLDCDSQSTCSLPSTLTAGGVALAVEDATLAGTGPYTVQYNHGAGNVIAAASANHGMGKMNIEADFTVNLPANTTYAGTYSSVFAVTFANTPV